MTCLVEPGETMQNGRISNWRMEWIGDTLTQEGKIMRKHRNLLRGIGAILVMVGIVACGTVESPPRDLVARNDRAALDAWYVNEAAHLRQRAKDMTLMAEEYEKNPGPDTRGVMSPKIDMVQHCQALAAMYTKAAEQAEVMAGAHREPHGPPR